MKTELQESEIKKICLDGLIKFKELCERYDLTYFLAYGTLLGAVRHSGYIPWDDDIDVCMPREDYEKLIIIANTYNKSGEWELIENRINKKYCFPWIKFCNKETVIVPSRFNTGMTYGLSIDIFPIDNISGDEKSDFLNNVESINNSFYRNRDILHLGAILESNMKSIIKDKINKCVFFVKTNFFYNISNVYENYLNDILNYSEKNTKYCTCIYLTEKYNSVFECKWFNGKKYLEFENQNFCVPGGYREILKEIYGDYMELPSVECRINPHTFKCYRK